MTSTRGRGRPHVVPHGDGCIPLFIEGHLVEWECADDCAWVKHQRELNVSRQRRYRDRHKDENVQRRNLLTLVQKITVGHTEECIKLPTGHPDRIWLIDGKRGMEWACTVLCVCEECLTSMKIAWKYPGPNIRQGYGPERFSEALHLVRTQNCGYEDAARFWNHPQILEFSSEIDKNDLDSLLEALKLAET